MYFLPQSAVVILSQTIVLYNQKRSVSSRAETRDDTRLTAFYTGSQAFSSSLERPWNSRAPSATIPRMDQKTRCQSCGMPIGDEQANYGTTADGSAEKTYCVFCYNDGAFTRPDLTQEQMIQLSIENMTQELKMPEERAEELARSVIPSLGRWKKS